MAYGRSNSRCFFCLALLLATTSHALTPAGCDDGWLYYKHNCYSFNVGVVHFDTAKAVCLSKGSTLTSLWTKEEDMFVEKALWQDKVRREEFVWVGLIPKNKGDAFVWADGSMYDRGTQGIPANISNICGAVQGKGAFGYMNCDDTMPGFVCKKPLVMVYISGEFYNHTRQTHFIDDPPKSLMFERLWPPRVQKFPTNPKILASIPVIQETDCAYRCFRVDDCRAFTLTCETVNKCHKFICKLIS
ncbi:hypothetical protein ScPMuIL_005318 [Solemya velum]